MKNWQRIPGMLLLTFFILYSSSGHAQNSKEISLSVYPGFTLVNFEKALGYSDDYMEDWSEFYTCVAIRGFLESGTQLSFGAEFAWQQLYYAYYRIPYISTFPVYREFNVSTYSMSLLGRYTNNNFFAVLGAGLHIFNNGVAPGTILEAGYFIKGGSNLKFPVSFRINPILGDGPPIPISVGIGASYTIK